MCKFQNEFLLCSCVGGDIREGQIDWILKRRDSKKRKDHELITVIGQRLLPNDFDRSNSEEFEKLKNKVLGKMRSLEKKQNFLGLDRFQDTTTFILSELNRKNCFDQKIELFEKDVLSIKLDQELGLWVDFLYRKSSWRIAKFNLNENQYLEIIKGEIKTLHNQS